jgi:hypothetical protein
VTGTVREVNGGPIAGATVAVGNPPLQLSTTTDSAGAFALAGITSTNWPVLIYKDGFLAAQRSLVPADLNGAGRLLLKMQPSLVLSAGSGLSSVITNDDVSYTSNGDSGEGLFDGVWSCGPCKVVAIQPARTGGRFRLHWAGSTPLDLWAGGGYGEVAASAAGVAGASDLVLDVPPGATLATVLVGVGPRNYVQGVLAGPEAFSLTVEP